MAAAKFKFHGCCEFCIAPKFTPKVRDLKNNGLKIVKPDLFFSILPELQNKEERRSSLVLISASYRVA